MPNQLVNEDKWLKINPCIKFGHIHKAYFGKYLIRIRFNIPGGALRWFGASWEDPSAVRHCPEIFPTQQDFTAGVLHYCEKYRLGDLKADSVILSKNRYVSSPGRHHIFGTSPVDIFDTFALYGLHHLRCFPPAGIQLSRHQDRVMIYGNDETEIEQVILALPYSLAHVSEINYAHRDSVEDMKAGKEFSKLAGEFGFKLFFKAFQTPNEELYEYLERLEQRGECMIPQRTKSIMLQEWPAHSWNGQHGIRFCDKYARSWIYTKDMSYLLFIMMIATDRISNFIELVPYSDK